MKRRPASRRTRLVARLVAELSSIRPEPLHLRRSRLRREVPGLTDTYMSPLLVQQQTSALWISVTSVRLPLVPLTDGREGLNVKACFVSFPQSS